MDETTKLLAAIKAELARKDETYALVASLKPLPCKDHTGPCRLYHGVCMAAEYNEWHKEAQ